MAPVSPNGTEASTAPTPPKHASYPKPKYLLNIGDLTHKGTTAFLSAVNAATVLEDAVAEVMRLLYDTKPEAASSTSGASSDPNQEDASHPIDDRSQQGIPDATAQADANADNGTATATATISLPTSAAPPPYPPVRSITLALHTFNGLAFTVNNPLDDEHKEIHLNLNYIADQPEAHLRSEILGVITHEMVHCWQWTAKESANGGLMEGVADWVRLNAGLAPGHWRRRKAENWDRGYETTGYFLEWLERVKVGEGTVRKLNLALRGRKYDEGPLFMEVCGKKVKELWEEYEGWVEKQGLVSEDAKDGCGAGEHETGGKDEKK